jgi:hypothetical protein
MGAARDEMVVLHDPNNSIEVKMALKEFMAKWQAPPMGFDNFFIAYAPGGTSLPRGRTDGIQATLTTSEGVTNLTNGLDRIGHFYESPGTALRGWFEVSAGIGQTVGGAAYTGLQQGGAWLDNAVADIPVVRNVVQPFAKTIEWTGAVGGDLLNGVNEGIADFGEGFEDLGKGDVVGFGSEIKEGVEEVVGGVVDAVEDTVGTVGSVIKSIFSW